MLKQNPDAEKLQQLLPGKQKLTVNSNDKVSHIHFLKPVSNVGLFLPLETSKGTAFGRMALDMHEVEIVVNHEQKLVSVHSELYSQAIRKERLNSERIIDDFDFNPDNRAFLAELAVRAVHQAAPEGSTSFRIQAVKGSYSIFKRTYKFSDF